MNRGQPLLELHEVAFFFEGKRRVGRQQILDGITFRLHPKEACALVGPSGIGKTSLARICAGLCPPTRGTIRFKGVPLEKPSSAITLSFQNYPCFPWLTVGQNLVFGLEETGKTDSRHLEYAAWLLAQVGLAEEREKYPRELSGGMQQRLSIARCLAVAPDLLILDEPFSALDRASKTALIEMLLQLQDAADFTLLVVLHDLADAYSLVDRAIVLTGRPARVTAEVPVSGHDQASFERQAFRSMFGADSAGDQSSELLSLLSAIRSRRIPDRLLIKKALEGSTTRLLGRRLGPEDREFVLKLLDERETERLRFGIRLAGSMEEDPEIQDALTQIWERALVKEARLDLVLALSRFPDLLTTAQLPQEQASAFIREVWGEFVSRVGLENEGPPRLDLAGKNHVPMHTLDAYRILASTLNSNDIDSKDHALGWLQSKGESLPSPKSDFDKC